MGNIDRIVLKSSYVYAILVDGVVRYIGKGTGERMFSHVKEALKINRQKEGGVIIKSSKFCNELAKSLLEKKVIEYRIIAKELSHIEAFSREVQEIAKCPKGQLWNIAPGGFGFSFKDLLDVEAYFTRLREGITEGNKKSETKLNRSKGAKRRWESEENRKQHSEVVLPAWTPELCRQHSKKFIERFSSYEEFLKHQSRSSKVQWTPEKCAKQSIIAKTMQAAKAAKKYSNLYCSTLSFGA